MRLLRPTDDELGEYVDGRLSEARRAEIAAWLLDNPRKATEVERLRRLNRALRDVSSEVLDEPVPERLREILRRGSTWEDEEPRPSMRSRSGYIEVAAAFVIFALGAITGWGAHSLLDDRVPGVGILVADAEHPLFPTGREEPAAISPAEGQQGVKTVATGAPTFGKVSPGLQPGCEHAASSVLQALGLQAIEPDRVVVEEATLVGTTEAGCDLLEAAKDRAELGR